MDILIESGLDGELVDMYQLIYLMDNSGFNLRRLNVDH